MCGFLIYINNEKITSGEEKKLFFNSINNLIHRGPDFVKHYKDKNSFIFHSRLSIQDLSNNSNQPMTKTYKNNKYIIIYNGEIYNFENLRSHLNIRFSSKGDTEVLLNSFILSKNYEKFLNSLDGMFSFLIKSKNDELFFARDRFGQKPLYYYKENKKIFFSSEIKPILSNISKKKISLDKESLKNYFLKNNFFSGRNTFFKNIFSVNSGEYGHVSKSNIDIKSYYNKNNFFLKKLKKEKRKFSKVFEENILKHLVADKRFAIALSDGLDSQSLAHVVLSVSKIKKEVMNYCIEFKGNKKNEFIGASKFVNSYAGKIRKIQIDEEYVIKNFEKFLIKNEGPLGGIMHIGMFRLAEFAKQDGFDVLLAGYGLDECFGSYKDIRKNSSKKDFNLIDGTNISNYKMTFFDSNQESKKDLISEYFFDNKIPRTVHMCDRFSMSNSIELRLPFLDHHFVEYCVGLNLPENNIDKFLVRKYMNSKSLFKKNWLKNKVHVPHPQNSWLKSGKLHDWAYSIISSNFLYQNLDFLCKKEIIKFWNSFTKDKISSGYPVWQLINMYYMVKMEQDLKIKKSKIF